MTPTTAIQRIHTQALHLQDITLSELCITALGYLTMGYRGQVTITLCAVELHADRMVAAKGSEKYVAIAAWAQATVLQLDGKAPIPHAEPTT